MSNPLQRAVSKKKRRFIDKENGFDLDLAYIIPDRVVAMGFPSEGTESLYRNSYKETYRLLELKHKDEYYVYNLCSERTYDPSKFHDRVGHYPFDDHNAPEFDLIYRFCVDVQKWLDENPERAVFIHCKAGKGRTGLMICCYLIFSGFYPTPESAQSYYAAMRTFNQKGVTIPSQIRYVNYFAQAINSGSYQRRGATIKKIEFTHKPKGFSSSNFQLSVLFQKEEIFSNKKDKNALTITAAAKSKSSKKLDAAAADSDAENDDDAALTFTFNEPLHLDGDIKFECRNKDNVFTFWVNTAFVTEKVVLTQPEIDKVNKDSKNKTYPKGFEIHLHFDLDEELGETVEMPRIGSAVDEYAKAMSQMERKTTSPASTGSKSHRGQKVSLADIDVADTPQTNVLNRLQDWEMEVASASAVAERLLRELIGIYVTLHKDNEGEVTAESIDAIRTSDTLASDQRFKFFQLSTAELRKVKLDALNHREKISFWLNVYHTLLLHMWLIRGVPNNVKVRNEVHAEMKYEVAGEPTSLAFIEQVLLKAQLQPSEKGYPFVIPKIGRNDVRVRNGLSRAEPRVIFGIFAGTEDSPPLTVYQSTTVLGQLEDSMAVVLENGLSVDMNGNEATLPAILRWSKDFGRKTELLTAVAECVSFKKRLAILSLIDNMSIKYSDLSATTRFSLIGFDNHGTATGKEAPPPRKLSSSSTGASESSSATPADDAQDVEVGGEEPPKEESNDAAPAASSSSSSSSSSKSSKSPRKKKRSKSKKDIASAERESEATE